jgi:putative endonuclease
MSPETCWVYLLASKRNGTLYLGSTRNLVQRIHQHREGLVEGFSKQYGVKMLVWFEPHGSVMSMATRERQLKEWKRAWKVDLIESTNPTWRDLFDDIIGMA